jgi:serine/threonine-protein kinase
MVDAPGSKDEPMEDDKVEIEAWAQGLTQRMEGYGAQERTWAKGEAAPTMTVRSPLPEGLEDGGEFASIESLRFQEVLARGGMGEIHVAAQPSIGRQVAVKRVLADRVDSGARRGLIAEARATGRLEHPNIVPVHELGVDGAGAPALVMRRVDGVSWMDVLTGHAPMPETFEGGDPLEAHLEIFDQVCLAAHFAHSRGILHRDIKPDNVMIGSHGEVYLVDWGLAVRFGEASHDEALPTVDQIRAPEGTPVYMAPEMVGVEVDRIGPRTDVYLLGALLHVVLMRSFRHTGDTGMMVLMAARASEPFGYPPEVPSYLARVCNKATSRALEDRHADVEELRRDVADFRRHLIAARLIEKAEAQLTVLDALAGLDEVDDDQMVLAYHSFAGAVFGFGQAIEAWPRSREALHGLADSRRAMFDVALLHGDLALCASLLEELGGGEDERASRLELAREDAARERARVAELERLERDLDPLTNRRLRGRVVLACVGALICTNVAYTALDAGGVAPITPRLSVLYKLIDTAVMQVILGSLLFNDRVNLVSRQAVHLFSVAIWSVFVLRVSSVLIGLTLPQAGVIETVVYSLGLAAGGVLFDRRLLVIWPLVMGATAASFSYTDFGAPVRALVNLSMLVIVGLTWAMSKRALEAEQA